MKKGYKMVFKVDCPKCGDYLIIRYLRPILASSLTEKDFICSDCVKNKWIEIKHQNSVQG